MSAERRIAILAGVFGALAVLYVVGLLVGRVPPPPVVVRDFTASAAQRIVVGSTHLRKQAGSWQVSIGGSWFPADTRKVEAMLRTLSGMTAGRVASKSRSDWATFQVDAASAAPLRVESGSGTLVDLYVGKTSSDGGVYIRSSVRPEVYDVFANVEGYVSAGPSYWSYLQILPKQVNVDSLQTISVSAHGFTVGGTSVTTSYLLESSVVGGKSAWVVHGRPKVTLDQKKVLALEAEIIRMEGDRFVVGKDATATGLDNPQGVIRVTDQQGASWTISVGKRYGAQFYVKRSGLPYTYLVNEWSLHRALPPLARLVAGGGSSASGS